jgi:hypothetical protein
LTSALAGGEWSASCPCRFTPGERAPGAHWIGGWVDHRAGMDDMEKRKFLTLSGLELRPLSRPARSQSLYRLSYRCSSSKQRCRTKLKFVLESSHRQAFQSRDGDWLRAGRPRGRSSSPARVKIFLFSTSSRPALRPIQLPIQWVPVAVSPGVKRPGSQSDHSPPASAEVKKMWIYTSTHPHAFMA